MYCFPTATVVTRTPPSAPLRFYVHCLSCNKTHPILVSLVCRWRDLARKGVEECVNAAGITRTFRINALDITWIQWLVLLIPRSNPNPISSISLVIFITRSSITRCPWIMEYCRVVAELTAVVLDCTVMRRIKTFRSTTDRIYDGGRIRL
jgi:hypothetical protein